MLSFPEAIHYFHAKLVNGEKFALGRFGDGEWGAIKGVQFAPGNGEWRCDSNDPSFEGSRQMLAEAIRYQHPQYHVAICPCYVDMLEFSGQPLTHVTYANIFVNANYSYYKEHFIKIYQERDVWLVANKDACLHDLPFSVERFFPIEYNAWTKNKDLIEEIIQEQARDKLFLFSAGPFANILAHRLWEANKDNVYLDIGSTLDMWMLKNSLNKRDYYMSNNGYATLSCPCDGVRPSCHWL